MRRKIAAFVTFATLTLAQGAQSLGQAAEEPGLGAGAAAQKVPSPWTPVSVEAQAPELKVSVWGRTYRFANAPLPTGLTTAQTELLASPIRLAAVVDGKPALWQQSGAFLLRQTDSQAIVSGWQAGDALIANTTCSVEFDGLMRVDLTVMPQQKASPRLERLWLEAPLRPERATLFHYWPGRWGSAENSGALPQSGLALPFKPFVWLGWEEGGLGWFAESDQGWCPQAPAGALEVVRQAGETTLRLHLLDSPPARWPVTFTLGFQATPVKPWPADFHGWHICHGAAYGLEQRPTGQTQASTPLERAAAMGLKTLVFHEDWTPIQNYWETTHGPQLQSLVAACHQHGIKLLLYFGYELSSLAPEWASLADEVLVKNPQGELAGGYHRQPEQRDYIVCYGSRWQDRLAEGVARAQARYGFDGVYLDGTIEPFACANQRHGCGYRAADGSLQPTYPIFAVRRLMQRLYATLHPQGALINAHQSTCCLTPTLAFCDSYWDGEQFGGGELAGDPLRLLPLSTFRAEFMGRNFGVPSEFLVYDRAPNWTVDHALAFTLLHDVRVRPGGLGEPLERMAKIWAAMDRFGASAAQWRPYWRKPPWVTAQPESVKVSVYSRPGQGSRAAAALLVVSNLSPEQPTTAQLTLSLPELGLSGPLKAADALTGESLRAETDRLAVPLPPMRMRLIVLEQK